MDSITHFQIPYDDQPRAQKFYENMFGWNIFKIPDVDYHWINTAESDEKGMHLKPGSIDGGMFQKHESHDQISVMVTVESVDEHLKKVESLGGQISMQKTQVGNYGIMAQIIDTEGNRIGLWQFLEHCQNGFGNE